MPVPALYGQEIIRNRLLGAMASGRLPQALLFEGPRGVGKQRLGLWLAQALLCQQGARGQEPCGECRVCRMVASLAHPDVHWFVPIQLEKRGADADKQVELVEEALAEEMAARRERTLYDPPSGLASHGIASVRLLLRKLVLKPAMAAQKVFIIGDAERLVPQRANQEAANALLKALEEPPADTVFVLTSAAPEAMLPTILSRVVRVRVARQPDSIVAAFAQRELGLASQRVLEQRVKVADGRIGRLLAEREGGVGSSQAAEQFLAAVESRGSRRYAFALAQQPFQARGGFTQMLDGLLERLRAEARAGKQTRRAVEAIAQVLAARELAQGNVNPQLAAAVLADDLAERE